MTRALSVSFALVALAAPTSAFAGGGPMNVLVVYSADDSEAADVAAYYQSARAIPRAQLCGIPGFATAAASIDAAAFKSSILAPVDACLAALPEPDEIDYLVLVRGLPYIVEVAGYPVSLEAALQVGHATDAGGAEIAGGAQPLANASIPNPAFKGGYFVDSDSPVTNPYAAWYGSGSSIIRAAEQQPAYRRKLVEDVAGFGFAGQPFIVQSLDGFDYDDARALVDRAVQSDGSLPTAEILCMRGEDEARAARDPECELVTRMLAGAGLPGVFVDPFDGALAGHELAGYFTGSADSVKNAIAGNTYVPGAITDNLTSYGAVPQNFICSDDGSVCPASESQTSCARFVRAGATGAHGTAVEPFNNVFPNAGAFLHYTFGYSMGEAYFFNQRFLYWENVHLGDPLATPYAVRPVVTLSADSEQVVVHAEHENGIAHVAVFRDGVRLAEADGADLSVAAPGQVGDELDLLAVAVANNAPVSRPGWPEAMQSPAPDVQGWSAALITLAPPVDASGGGGAGGADAGGAGSGGASGADEDGAEDGCGCRITPHESSPAVSSLLWLALLARRRRRPAGY